MDWHNLASVSPQNATGAVVEFSLKQVYWVGQRLWGDVQTVWYNFGIGDNW